ncbi:CopG family transcriptional regulator [Streptomyces sp. SID10815]|uniref:ribbon-helix-helix domain-containing protein n=1 Tax=Streptomyces sp. SID10815 TaxID=2706027 RepID=UPI001EF1FD34|nr:CopG family transcriptional regulator [Streptomyces sp. SID10815]
MALKRVSVLVEGEDLDLIKAAAARRGVSEAELLREGVHRIAWVYRAWSEPFVSDGETFDLGGPPYRK